MSLAPAEVRVRRLFRQTGVVRVKDLEAGGLSRMTVRRLCEREVLHRVGRGLYSLADAAPTENRTLVEAALRVPSGVVCLLSALRFHGMTTQAPHEVWLALPKQAWTPKADWPPLRLTKFSPSSYAFGVEEHDVEGVHVRVTSPAKTVADCFKFRGKVGKDVALEALRDYRRERRGSVDTLLQAAEADRVAAVMRPYLEALS